MSKTPTMAATPPNATVWELLRYARPQWPAIATCVVLAMLASGLQLAQPYLVKVAIDDVILPATTGAGSGAPAAAERLGWLVTVYGGLLALATIAQVLQVRLLQRTAQSIVARLRLELHGKLLRQDVAFVQRRGPGELVSVAMNDGDAIARVFTDLVVGAVIDLAMVTVVFALMLSLDVRLAVAVAMVFPLLVANAVRLAGQMRGASAEVQRELGRLSSTMSEYFAGMSTIQVHNRQARHFAAFRAVNAAHYQACERQLRVSSVFNMCLHSAPLLSMIVIVGYGGWLTYAETLTVGTLAAFIAYNAQLFTPITGVADRVHSVQASLAALARIFELLGAAPTVADPAVCVAASPGGDESERAEGPAVEFRNVWFAYREGEWVLRDVSFTVAKGEHVALAGPSGAGKSTIVQLICRFYDVQAGSVLVDGLDVRAWPPSELRRRLGIVLQDVQLVSGTIGENIALGSDVAALEAIVAAAETASAARFIEALPDGYEHQLSENGRTLSQGQRQLLALARVLLLERPILLMDEATASVDATTEAELSSGMHAAAAERTCIVVAHRVATIRASDRVLFLCEGELLADGPHDQLFAENSRYRGMALAMCDQAEPAAKA